MKGGKEDEENEEGRMQWHDGTATAAKQAEEAPLSNLGGEWKDRRKWGEGMKTLQRAGKSTDGDWEWRGEIDAEGKDERGNTRNNH